MGLRDETAVQQNANQLNTDTSPRTFSGVVIAGSWNPATATVQVLVGTSIPYESPAFNDGINQPHQPVCTIVGGSPYDQTGPVGGEHVQVWEDDSGGPESSGWVCSFETADPAYGPQPPAGGRRIFHRSAANPNSVVFDAGIEFTNDGSTPGDNLGGTIVGNEGALTKSVTKAGWDFALDDTGKLATLKSPLGVLIQIDDNTGKVYIGANGLGSGHAVMTEDGVASALNALATNLQTWAAAHFQAGASTPPAPTVPTVTGSTTVFAKE